MPLFLCLSGLFAGTMFLLVGMVWPELFTTWGSSFKDPGWSDEEWTQLFQGWTRGLKSLGLLMVISSTLLYLLRKKLSNLAFSGIFALLMIICVVAASYIAML